jgi:hypothetical protein
MPFPKAGAFNSESFHSQKFIASPNLPIFHTLKQGKTPFLTRENPDIFHEKTCLQIVYI